MSDTKTLIKYVRDRLNDGPNITFGKPTVLDLVEALESAEAEWGGEIPSPFPGHKPPSEDAMVERFNHLNCPLCGGSGHIDDCDKTSAEAIARLTKMVDFMAQQMADVYSTDEDGRYVLTRPVRTLRAADHDCDKISCPQCWKEAARRAVAAGEE